MKEVAVQFGDRGYLFGILTQPEHPAPVDRPAIIMLNAGLTHRVGPSRTHVALARRLAKGGSACLRFDHGGIGDSGTRRDSLSFEEGGSHEVVAAMDHLSASIGASRFVIFGVCTGARMALKVAHADPRVVGVVSLDGQMFGTWRFWWNRWRQRRGALGSIVARRLLDLMPGRPRGHFSGRPGGARQTLPSKAVVGRQLQDLVLRGTDLYWIFTGSFAHVYNYREQFRDSFRGIDLGDRLRVDYLPAAKHVLPALVDQEHVIGSVCEWVDDRWPAVRSPVLRC